LPDGRTIDIELAKLMGLPKINVPDCFIVSTGHGTSGPFVFSGTSFKDFVGEFWGNVWTQAEVVSADGFGTRIWENEVTDPSVTRPIVLAYEMDGEPLTRQQGLVRLIVPSETDDALRQVKWVGEIRILG
jgi:DMSO/TMAO reductase YedYZ molybdopterin-dependent catalytic subunit